MKSIRVTFNDGNTIETNINGSIDEIKSYYIGQWFNFGDNDWGEGDKMRKAILVEEVA